MGQKVHPYGFRLGYTKPWKSRWYMDRDYDKFLIEDIKLKEELKDKLKSAGSRARLRSNVRATSCGSSSARPARASSSAARAPRSTS